MTKGSSNSDSSMQKLDGIRRRKLRKAAAEKRISHLISDLLPDQKTKTRSSPSPCLTVAETWSLFHKNFEGINYKTRPESLIFHETADTKKCVEQANPGISDYFPDLVALSKQHKVVEELKRRRVSAKMLRRRHREELRNEVAEIYHFAEFLQHSESDWLDFCRDPDWEGFRGRPRPEDQKQPLKFVFRFHVGFGGTSETKKASRFDCALTPLFENGTKAHEIPAILKRSKGIIGLSRKHAEEKKAAALAATADQSVVSLQMRCGKLAETLREIGMGAKATLRVRIDANEPALMEMSLLQIKLEN